MTEGFFFAQQTPCGAEREKSGRHKPLQCRRGAARGRPERATDPQEAWRKTRNNAVRSRVRMSVSRLFGERMEQRRVHHLPMLRNESKRAERGARWRDVMWWRWRKPECRGDERRLGDCCGRSSTPGDDSSLQGRSAVRSLCYQRPSHGRDFPVRDGTVAAAVETVGDASGENEELIRPEHAILSPYRKRPARTVKVWRHRRNRATIDDE